ncbi:MAG: hypothetical protein VB875_01770, partial [Pirellulales bacterium]
MNENENNLLDDPRLTAYALDQLPDDERGEVEQLLEQSAEAREAVTKIRRAGELLRGAMLSEPADAASPSLREAVVANLAAAASVAESSVAESPVAESPVAESPVAESPVAELPVAELPVAELPVAESPAGPQSGRSRSNVFGVAIAAGLLVGLTVGVLVLQNIWSPASPLAEVRDVDGGTDGATANTGSGEKAAKSRSYGEYSELEEEARRRVPAGFGDDARGAVPAEWNESEYSAGTSPSVVGGHGRAKPSARFFDDLRRGGQGQSRPGRRPQPKFAEQRAGEFKPESVASNLVEVEAEAGVTDLGRSGQLQNQNENRLGLGDQGGSQADFDALIELIQTTIEPDDESKRDDRDEQPFGNTATVRKAKETVGKDKEISGKRDGDKDQGRSNKQADRQKAAADAEKKPAHAGKVKQLVDGWRRSRKLPNTSRLMIGDREELPLQGMQVNVQIDGFRARVLLDMYYLNTHPRQLEGNFQLRLPNEASLYFFAFGETAYGGEADDRPSIRQAFYNLRGEKQLGTAPAQIMQARAETWKAAKEARMVTRVRAAHAYRETVRRRVDPALVEWAGAGIFSARVFPLMPQKLHRVVIGYDVNLLRLGDDLVYRLDLPDGVGECTVDLNVAAKAGKKAQIRPKVRPFTAAGRAYFHYDRPEYRQFEVRLVDSGNTLIHGEDPESGPFFAASFLPQLPAGGDVAGAERAVFLVDTSLSSNPEKFNVWLSLLKATLTNNRGAVKQFAVLFFNIEKHWWREKFVDNTEENVAELAKYCHTLALEGATDLGGALRAAAAPSWQPLGAQKIPRDYFLLSDGAITWGERDLHLLTKAAGFDGAIFAYRTGLAGTDIHTLAHLTRETGGAVFTVAGDEQVEAASKAHRQRPWQLVDVRVDGGSDFLLAGQPRTLFAGQQLLLVGRGAPGEDAKISLKVRRGDQRKTVNVKFDQLVDSDLASRIYGQVSTAGLEEFGDGTDDVSAAYARHFRITGRTCSLLMLESEEDYQRFNIKPQEDAFVVKSTEAAAVIATIGDQMAARLGDPKATFLAWVNKLETTPGLAFRLSPAVKLAMDALPGESFGARIDSLSCNERTWEPIAEPLREMLSLR